MKNLSKLGKALNKAEQKTINGGRPGKPECCNPNFSCCTTNPNYSEFNRCRFIYSNNECI